VLASYFPHQVDLTAKIELTFDFFNKISTNCASIDFGYRLSLQLSKCSVEDELIKNLQQGSESAFREIVSLYKNKVVNTCFGFVNNAADADDLAQEVFVEVFQSIHYFNQDSTLSTWIYRISVNKSLDHLRKINRKKRWAQLIRLTTQANEINDSLIAHEQTPESTLEDKERLKVLLQAIGKLPENQRTAFTLHKNEDLSYKEISEVMKTSVSSVESLIHRAKKNLKESLTHYYASEK